MATVAATQPRRSRQLIAMVLVGTYFAINGVAKHLDGLHIGLAGIIAALYVLHQRTRAFLAAFFPMLLYLLVYDLTHFLPRSWHLPVHVEALHRFEGALFGTGLHTFFLTHYWPWADIVAAITYSLHYWGPILFGLLLWRRYPQRIQPFAWAFFWLNIASLVVQLLYPTAPPWYFNQYGMTPADPFMLGDPGGLARIDTLLGRPYFLNMYHLSAIVFGAMPSMHGAWPVLMLCFSGGLPRSIRYLVIGFGLLMWGSAVYLQHHYIVDLVVGAGMAIITAKTVRKSLSA